MCAGVQYTGRLAGRDIKGRDVADTDILDSKAARDLLMESAVIISSFSHRVEAAGYPFQLPPGTKRIITEIDMLLHPPTSEKVSKQILSKTGA